MKKQVAVVIPYYHNELSETERISFQQCINVLLRYPIILIVPDNIKVYETVPVSGVECIKVPSKWMQSIETYNQMMLNVDFYRMFLAYEYILIYQLDAFVFRDELKEFCDLGYDYIGAPWLFGAKYFKKERNRKGHVGNGGLSLRNVKASILVLKKNPVDDKGMPEDVYWSSHDSEEFRVAPKEAALRFSIEEPAEKMFYLNKKRLPFGCHAWNKISFSFWKPFIEKEGYVFSGTYADKFIKSLEGGKKSIWKMSSEAVYKGIKYLAPAQEKLYVWGAGIIGKKWVIALRCAGFFVKCVDNNMERWGEYLWDVCIESPDILRIEREQAIVFIAVKRNKEEIKNQLSQIETDCRMKIIDYDEALEVFESMGSNYCAKRIK